MVVVEPTESETRESTMTWVIAGASGPVGRYVMRRLLAEGAQLRILSHSGRVKAQERVKVLPWDPAGPQSASGDALASVIDALDGADVVLNLAGHSLGSGRLGADHRRQVLESRLQATSALVAAWERAESAPRRWLQASAVGYYGDAGHHWVTEDSPPGALFLSEVCVQWEQCIGPVVEAGCIASLMRLGLVLAPDAPAIQRMLRPIRMGVGGRLGRGDQYWPWITAPDVAGAIHHLSGVAHAGPINLVAPDAVTQIEFTRAVARALRRPSWIPAPGFALRVVAGGAADELVLPSCRARAEALLATGFRFTHPGLREAVPWLLRSE
ncbi:MAG TPA: TIGR01777 family protein [Deltaproteobacteria bacterium]|nr:TIGR01777 family protein [Deltaproteobacteria bacterium]HCP45169.1 TIGR01777 family protein [Deltaproteobacteria bacterium]